MGNDGVIGGGNVLIGVSLAVPEPYGSLIQDARTGYGDTQAHGIPTHVTLLPPTAVPLSALPDVDGHLVRAAADHRPFQVTLRGTGTFRPVSQVVFVQLEQGVRECRALEASVRSGPLARELAFPYHPHVTVAHDLPDEALDRAFTELRGFEAGFPVEGFSLYRFSTDDQAWRPLRGYGFPGAAGAATGSASAR
ncbi:2'-5' RNA ligase family protein [Streptacidiphilus melanogenes]|uniref:2'-5' RNA ligase family protein n=1 Tax=Streptacidiphilus melanogenes TaxID=411235 RepID=UPI0005A97B59|nr:2'-5' RNA ligase family protein [Streptacidiphilus melanogenes]